MTQIVPATAVLGAGKTGLAIGYRVLNLGGTVYSAFTTVGVAETLVAGTYRVAGGISVPNAGGYIVWGVSGTDYAEATVDGNINIDATAVTYSIGDHAGHLTITAGRTFNAEVMGLTIPADWATAIWTVKRATIEDDTAAVVQLRETNPGSGADGLIRLNGAAPVVPITASSGALTVSQVSGSITIYIKDEATILLGRAEGLGWDLKFIDADGDSTGTRGTLDVDLTETKAVA